MVFLVPKDIMSLLKNKKEKKEEEDIMPWSMHEIANVLSIGLRVPLMQLRIAGSRL